jgi:centromere protein I
MSSLVQRIAQAASTSGVPAHELTALVDVLIEQNYIDQGNVTTLIKNLYPVSRVQSSVIAKIVCSIGVGKGRPHLVSQALLLQWLLLVYEVAEDPSCFSRLYRTLFNHLDMLSLRRPLCHLLCVITRRKHVKPFRIQALLELQEAAGHDLALASLIRVYKDYYPDLVVTDIRVKRWNHFAHPDHGWVDHLRVVQASNLAQESYSAADLDRRSSFKVIRRGTKRSRVGLVPEVRTSVANEGSTTLEEVENAEDFVGNLEKTELPNQLISAILDPLAMKLLKVLPDSIAELRLNQWLEGFFRDANREAEDVEESRIDLGQLLETALDYIRHTKVSWTSP